LFSCRSNAGIVITYDNGHGIEDEFSAGQTFVGKLETAKLRKMTIRIYNNNP